MDKILQDLIAIPSVCGDFVAAQQAIDYAADFLRERGMHIRHYEESGFPSLVATTRPGTKTPTVMLAGHLDVVPGPEELFTLREQNGKYFGRGVFDMKFAVASYLHIIDDLMGHLDEYDFGIMLTTDEEQFGPYGTGMLIEKEGYLPKVCVLPDGATNWDIETFAKGRWFLEFKVNGRSAHGARPWEGDSASVKLVELLHELHGLFADGQQPDTHSLNIGKIDAGEMVNQIPGEATAAVDIRYVEPDFMERTVGKIRELCEKYDATFTELSDNALPVKNELTNPYIAAFAECITAETGVVPKELYSYATSDARFFMKAGVPCVVTSPAGGERHSDEEWISVAGYKQLHKVLRAYLDKMARI